MHLRKVSELELGFSFSDPVQSMLYPIYVGNDIVFIYYFVYIIIVGIYVCFWGK